MAEIRTLKLNLLADVDSFTKGLKKADTKTTAWSKNVTKASKIAAAGFAAAGAAVTAYAIEAVKAAAEDEKSQARLAKALKNTTHATTSQIAATEEWITKQQMSYGISDSKLRPALQRLVTATRNVSQSQTLLGLAMDISAGTGKDLEAVSIALGKAYTGNLSALKRLGVPLSDSIIKSKDFKAATAELSATFSGQAATAAATYSGKLQILNERVGEFQESIGAKLLPVLSNVINAITQVADGFGGKTGLSKRVGEASDALQSARDEKYENSWYNVGASLKYAADQVGALFASFNGPDGKQATNAIKSLANAITSVADAIRSIKTAYDKLPAPVRSWMTSRNKLTSILESAGLRGQRALGGPVTGGGSYLVGERGPEIFTPRSSGSITSNSAMGGNTFVFNGVIDGESARRSIERLFQTSSRISGAPNFTGNLS